MEHFPTSAVNPYNDQGVFEEPTPAPATPRDLRFSDWPMFNKVVEESPDICRRLLEVILDEPLEAVEIVIGERAIEPRLGARGVRLDAFVRGSGRIYDVEMQAQSVEALGRRMRYYQASMDTGELRKGKEYVHLPDSFIVFICRNDHFGRKQPIYRFSMTCEQDSEAHLEEGVHWLVLNASAWEDAPNEPLGRLLQYIETENPGADPLAQDIDALVAKANADAIWKAKGAELLTHLQDAKIQADYRAEMALKQGLEEGRLEGEQRLGLLITKLEKAGRTDDVLSAATDALRRDALYAEFGI